MSGKAIRILAFDLSIACPGAAVVEIDGGKAKVIAVSHVKTDAKQPYAIRSKTIESWAHLFIGANQQKPGKAARKPYDVILRESYAGRFGHHPIFSAWAAVDRALNDFGLADTTKPIAQQSVKKAVVGKGRAEKEEVAEAVRRLTGYSGEFASSDESDAVAIALAYAIQNGLIEKEAE